MGKNRLNPGIAQKQGGGGFWACPNCLEHFFFIEGGIFIYIFYYGCYRCYYRGIVCDFPAVHWIFFGGKSIHSIDIWSIKTHQGESAPQVPTF